MLQNSTPNRRFVRREPVGPICRHIDPNPRSRSVINGHRCEARLSLVIRPNSISCVDIHTLLRNTYRVFQHSVKPTRPKTTLRIARGALSPFTLVPETPARRSCRRDKSNYVHRVPK